MLINRTPLITGLMALALAAPALAQTPAAPTTPVTPPAATAPVTPPATTMDPAAPGAAPAMDCDADFTRRDTDGNGMLSETEAPSYYARARIDGKDVSASGVTREEYLAACNGDAFDRTEPEAGAPFEGANSFTENQARDRAVAWGLTDVAEMSKDDKGIWRSSGKLDGADVDIAVDYKGNVVTSAK